jgi:hypothetical protein
MQLPSPSALPYMLRCTGVLLVFCVFFSQWLNRYTDIEELARSMPGFVYEVFQMFLATSGMLLLVIVIYSLFEYVTVDSLTKSLGDQGDATSFKELGERAADVVVGALSVRVSSLWMFDTKALSVYAGAFFASLAAAVIANAWVAVRSGKWNELAEGGDLVPENAKRTPEYDRLCVSSIRCVLAFQLTIMSAGLIWYCVAASSS